MVKMGKSEVLGHSDANLTAKVYTDVASLALHEEIAKLPWISAAESGARLGAQKPGASRPQVSLQDLCTKFIEAIKVHEVKDVRHALASAVTLCPTLKVVDPTGLEPAMLWLTQLSC